MPDLKDLETKLQVNGTITTSGLTLSGANNNEQNTNMVNDLNSELTNINLVHNQLGLLNNNTQEVLLKKEELIQLENDTLNEQIQKLESIQGNIINKDRHIEEININIENQNRNINVLIFLLILAIILLIVVYINGIGKINNNNFIKIICVIIFIFFIIVIYSYNIIYFRDAITYLFDRRSLRIGNALKEWNESVINSATIKLYGTEDDYIKNNCNCPISEQSSSVMSYYGGINNTDEKSGYFYYDGTAPKQLLVPQPDNNDKDKIIWPDYSNDASAIYTPNNTTYFNTNYYNYKPNTTVTGTSTTSNHNDPMIKALNDINVNNKFVNDDTKTRNM